MELLSITLLNGLAWGLMLFLVASGLTLAYGMLGVLNFAHGAFFMVGAYLGHEAAEVLGFWPALLAAPAGVALLAALLERFGLRPVRASGHVAEMLTTFGFALLAVEAVQLLWGRAALPRTLPPVLDSPLAVVDGIAFPAWRGLMMGVALLALAAIASVVVRTRIGLVIRAARHHPHMVEALGHDLPTLHTAVFAAGAALAALAGVVCGQAFVTEPAMAQAIGSIAFVVVVLGGPGSLGGAFAASLLIGLLQTAAVAVDRPLAALFGLPAAAGGLTLAQVAPAVPYLLLVAVLVLRPDGLRGAGLGGPADARDAG